jgi:hypothetical protein
MPNEHFDLPERMLSTIQRHKSDDGLDEVRTGLQCQSEPVRHRLRQRINAAARTTADAVFSIFADTYSASSVVGTDAVYAHSNAGFFDRVLILRPISG